MADIKYLLKFGKREHLESLVSGNIYCSNAITFWGIEDKLKIKGQGDILEVLELYVDTFFVDQGIGGKLLDFAVSRNCNSLWVLEKNTKAQHFYLRHGFTPSGVRQLEEGTEQFIIEMIR